MSDYTPITGELRERIRQAEHIVALGGDSKDMQVRINLAWLTDKLDAIDSVHAQLERENAALKAELDRVLGEGVPMTDENMADERLVRLPVDADDEPIQLCDAMVANDGVAFTVDCVSLHSWGWRIVGDGHDADGNECTVHTYPELCRHQQPDTWERIIEDAIVEGMARQRNNDSGNFCERANPMNNGDLVARCKALCERTKEEA